MQGSPFLPRISRPKAIFFCRSAQRECLERYSGMGSRDPPWAQCHQTTEPGSNEAQAEQLTARQVIRILRGSLPSASCHHPIWWRGHLPALEPQLVAQHTGQHLALHIPSPQSCSTSEAGMHPLQLYCPNSHFWENGGRESWWQQR